MQKKKKKKKEKKKKRKRNEARSRGRDLAATGMNAERSTVWWVAQRRIHRAKLRSAPASAIYSRARAHVHGRALPPCSPNENRTVQVILHALKIRHAKKNPGLNEYSENRKGQRSRRRRSTQSALVEREFKHKIALG